MSNHNFSFNPKIEAFLENLKSNNNKYWFEERREFYESEIKSALREFLAIMGEKFAEARIPYFAEPKLSLFRINRDVRFSKDKSPYKTNLGIFFPYLVPAKPSRSGDAVGFYFHIEPKRNFFGAGVRKPSQAYLKRFREILSKDADKFDKIFRETLRFFPDGTESDSLKRMPGGFEIEPRFAKYLKYKEFIVAKTLRSEEVFSREIADLTFSAAAAAEPFLKFLSRGFELNKRASLL